MNKHGLLIGLLQLVAVVHVFVVVVVVEVMNNVK